MKRLYLPAIFSCLFHLAFFIHASAQVLYVDSLYRYKQDNQNEGWNIFLANDTTYYVVGLGTGHTSQPYGRVFTLQIASKGTLLNSTSFFDTSTIAYVSIGRHGAAKQLTGSDTHGYLVPVTKIFMAIPSPGVAYPADAGLMLLDYKGDTVFSKTYPHPDSSLYDVAYACDSLPDGGFIIAGTRTDTAKGYKQYGLVMRTDNVGNLLWSKTYETGFGSQNYLTSIQYIGNGQILLGGSYEFLYYPGGYLVTTDLVPWFLSIDTAGKIIKSLSSDYIHSNNEASGANIFKDRNGGFFYFGAFDYAKDRHDHDNDPLNNVPYVAHLDDSLASEWVAPLLDSVTFYNIWGAKQLKSGDYLMYGSAIESKPPYAVAWAAKINKSGILLWHHIYNIYVFSSINGFCEITDVAEHKDGSLIFVGDATDSFATTPAIYTGTWLLGVDSNGVENGIYTTIPSIQDQPANIVIYPNPSKGSFVISSDVPCNLTIFESTGRAILRKKLLPGKTNMVMPSDISSGNYFLQFGDSNGKVLTTKNISVDR